MQVTPQRKKPEPPLKNVHNDEFFLLLEWSNGQESKFPLIFLQDNARGVRHANGQKLIETGSLRISPRIERVTLVKDKGVIIQWANWEGERLYDYDWLLTHDFYAGPPIQAKAEYLWDNHLNLELPESNFASISNNPMALCTWLGYVRTYGFALLRQVPPIPGMIAEVVRLFGFIRETNYGKIFDVKTIINPGNLAFTGLGISAHTDNPYRNPTPTLQLLHCLSSDANGGHSILADGFRIADDLRREYPDYFKILSTVMVSYQFRDGENWLEHQTPVITLYPDGTLAAIRLNNRSIQPVKLPPDDLLRFYQAYLQFVRMTNETKYSIQFKMQPGDLYIVDNERVTHARSAYDNKAGERWLQGAYADRDALISKWRILQHRQSHAFDGTT